MRLAIIGLGKMGGNMARRLCRGGIEVVGYNRSKDIINTLSKEEGMIGSESVVDAIQQLRSPEASSPKVVWIMLPDGNPTENMINDVIPLLDKGDVIVDGGNSNYHDTQRRGSFLAEQGIRYIDVGTSGGVWGLDNGYCMMVGGDKEAVSILEPVLKVLAPGAQAGWAHVGPVGAGHFTKMVHNGIEYGMMQAFAEGFALIRGKKEFDVDLAELAEIWRHGSVVRSWLLDLTAESLKTDQNLEDIAPYVSDSGEGRWTAIEAIDQGVASPVMTLALLMRFTSQDKEGYTNRLLSMMRNAFGGHAIQKSK
ncbi:MAG: decarboxylating 6-phosphogluconate dehydrogenase [Gammaproteobacteria bacterium]|nr:decarboxylating 6-phosphogluconate dehydrogenase [Gammaproteobacteria bacterium]